MGLNRPEVHKINVVNDHGHGGGAKEFFNVLYRVSVMRNAELAVMNLPHYDFRPSA